MERINDHYVRYVKLPSYEEFYKDVMSNNILCTFPGELTAKWKCRTCWITNDGSIDFEYLSTNYGNMECPVYKCNEAYFNSNPCSTITVKDYVKYWTDVIACDHRYEDNSLDILYLKDWHLFCDTEHDQELFQLPDYFRDDYLNDYCVAMKKTDYKFVYLGPKNSSTPLHTDVFGSYSWSANICGRKRWLFIPECNVGRLKSMLDNKLPQSLYKLNNFSEICQETEAFEIIQNPGEVVFVPSGFMHEVHNLEDTISINHNWFNACNVHRILEALSVAYKEVQIEIEHLKEQFDNDSEWLQSCDKILTIHFGMNLETFTDILKYNLQALENTSSPDFHRETDIEILNDVLLKISEIQNK